MAYLYSVSDVEITFLNENCGKFVFITLSYY